MAAVQAGPTQTPTPKFPLLAGTPLPQSSGMISPANVGSLVQLARWGKEQGVMGQAIFTPDGKSIAIATSLGIYLFDPASLAQRSWIETSGAVNVFQFSPDGRTLAVALETDKDNIQLLNPNDGTTISTIRAHKTPVTSLAFSPDGILLASGSADPMINLWQGLEGSVSQSISGHASSGATGTITAL